MHPVDTEVEVFAPLEMTRSSPDLPASGQRIPGPVGDGGQIDRDGRGEALRRVDARCDLFGVLLQIAGFIHRRHDRGIDQGEKADLPCRNPRVRLRGGPRRWS